MLQEITGQTQDHLVYDENLKRYFHKNTYEKFLNLKLHASQAGIDLYILSSFRSFQDQLNIWNKKCLGEKTLFDSFGAPIDYSKLGPDEIVFAILRWSALPGTSRHHWGTDLDVVDKNTWPAGYHVELVPSEFSEGGPFHKMKLFFDDIIKNQNGLGFYRPYEYDKNGVAPEMWHISDRTTSEIYFQNYSYNIFCEFLDHQDPKEYLLLDIVKKHSKQIFEQYITNILR